MCTYLVESFGDFLSEWLCCVCGAVNMFRIFSGRRRRRGCLVDLVSYKVRTCLSAPHTHICMHGLCVCVCVCACRGFMLPHTHILQSTLALCWDERARSRSASAVVWSACTRKGLTFAAHGRKRRGYAPQLSGCPTRATCGQFMHISVCVCAAPPSRTNPSTFGVKLALLV